MTTKQRRSNGVNRRATKNKSPESCDNRIPSFQSDQVESLTMRFCVDPSYGSDVKAFTLELPIVPFGVADTATTLLLPFKSVRLKRVKMWCVYRPEKDISGNTINLTVVERRLNRPIEWSDTASYSCNAFLSKKFAKFDPMGQWYLTTSGESNPELTFQLPKGGVLELTFDYILADGQNLGTSSGSGLSFPRVYANKLNADILPIGKGNYAVIAA